MSAIAHDLRASLLPLPYPHEIQQWDKAAHALGIPEAVLMENAAQAAFAILGKSLRDMQGKHIWFMVGSGNNGGDAACMARYALNAGAYPLIIHRKALRHYRGVSALQLRIAKKLGIPMFRLRKPSLQGISSHGPHAIVDGLLGTGFHGPLSDELHALVCEINTMRNTTFILALDIPSGLDGITGKPSPIAVMAHATTTFGAFKPGIVLPSAREWTGTLHLCPIGLPKPVIEHLPCSAYLLDSPCLATLSPLPGQSHKNSYGHVFVIGGASGLEGAAHLAARSALRTGAGLVTVVTSKHAAPLVKNGLAEIMTLAVDTNDDAAWPCSLSSYLVEKLGRATGLVIGPGMGRSAEAALFLAALLSMPGRPPAIIDADALTLAAQHREILSAISPDDIITPHPGEAASLLGETNLAVQEDRLAALERLCQMQAGSVILKGAATIVGQVQKSILISPFDIPQLAVGGSGDVLAGVLGALVAQCTCHGDSHKIAAQGAVLHALAGLACAKTYGQRGNLASEIADAIPSVLASYRTKNPAQFFGSPHVSDHS